MEDAQLHAISKFICNQPKEYDYTSYTNTHHVQQIPNQFMLESQIFNWLCGWTQSRYEFTKIVDWIELRF